MGAHGSAPARDGFTIPTAAAVLAAGVLAMTVAPVLVVRAAMDAGHPAGLRTLLAVSEIALAAPALIVLALAAGGTERAGLRPVAGRTLAVSVLAGAALWAASLGLMQIQAWLWPPSARFLELFRQLHAALRPANAFEAALSVAAIALFPAACEELVFRGVVLPALARRMGAATAVLASALLFGLIHLDLSGGSSAFFRVPFAIFVGTGLGVLRLTTASLVPPMVAHAVLNTITFATVALSGAADQPVETSARPLAGAAMMAAGSGVTIVLLRLLRRR